MKLSTVFLIQGVYYILTGAWPLIDIDTFMEVTGPKTDVWLVKMVGLLTVSIAITLLAARNYPNKLTVLAICAALSYLFIDVYYVLNGTIRKIYLADAAIECLIILAIIFSAKKQAGA